MSDPKDLEGGSALQNGPVVSPSKKTSLTRRLRTGESVSQSRTKGIGSLRKDITGAKGGAVASPMPFLVLFALWMSL